MVSKYNRIASLVILNYKIFLGEVPQTPLTRGGGGVNPPLVLSPPSPLVPSALGEHQRCSMAVPLSKSRRRPCHHRDKRNKLINDLKNIEPNININSTLIQTGSNDKNQPLHIQNKIIKLIFNFVLLVLEDSTKLKVQI